MILPVTNPTPGSRSSSATSSSSQSGESSRSLLSRATYRPRAGLDAAVDRGREARCSRPASTTRTSGQRSRRYSTESSVEPLSTTVTSKSRKLCSARVSSTISRYVSPSRGRRAVAVGDHDRDGRARRRPPSASVYSGGAGEPASGLHRRAARQRAVRRRRAGRDRRRRPGSRSLDDGDEEYLFLTHPEQEEWLRPVPERALPAAATPRRRLRSADGPGDRQGPGERDPADRAPLLGARLRRDGRGSRAPTSSTSRSRTPSSPSCPSLYQPHDLQHLHLPELFSALAARAPRDASTGRTASAPRRWSR